MLSNILLIHVLRIAGAVLGVVAIAVGLVFGADVALAVAVGGALMVLDGVGLVYLVGRLLDPTVPGGTKGLFTLVLIGKLTIVAGLLWACLSVWAVHQLGLLMGMGIGLMLLVLGVSRGSTSEAAQAAMREEEARIAQEMGDNEE